MTTVDDLVLRHARRLLGERLTLDDDIFAVGAGSLDLLRFAAAVCDELGREVPMGTFMTAPSLGVLAARIRDDDGLADPVSVLPPLVPVARQPDARYPVSAVQWRQMQRRRRTPDMPPRLIICAWHVVGSLDLAALQAAVTHVCGLHEALRTRFFFDADGAPWQQVRAEPRVQLRVHHVAPGEDRLAAARAAIGDEVAAAFDWEHDDLLRLHVAVLGEHEYVVALVVDHLVSDGWSTDLLVDQLGEAYDAVMRGAPPASRPPAVQLIDHELWVRSWQDEPVGEPWRRFWSQVPRATQAPAPRSPHPAGPVRAVHQVAAAAMERLEWLAKDLSVPVFAVHLAMAGRAVAGQLDLPQVNVQAVVAGRRSAVTGTVGRFIHAAVFAVPGPALDLVESCRTVGAQLRAALSYQDLPGGVRNRNRDGEVVTDRSPLFFYVNDEPPVLHLGECTATPVDLDEDDPGWTNLCVGVDSGLDPRITVVADQSRVDPDLVRAIGDAWLAGIEAADARPTAAGR